MSMKFKNNYYVGIAELWTLVARIILNSTQLTVLFHPHRKDNGSSLQWPTGSRCWLQWSCGRGKLKCDVTRAETRFLLSAKRTSPFKSVGPSVQSTIGSRGVRISGSNAGYTMFRGSVKGTGYPLHSLVSPSFPFPCVTVCHHISTGLYT